MRMTVWSPAAACAVMAVLAIAGCAAPPAHVHPSPGRCQSYGVQAIDRHITVRTVPLACAGLSPTQVNEAVESAIRQAVGPLPKAAARRRAEADGRYLAPLIRTVRPAPEQSARAGGPQSAPALTLALAGLACWLGTAVAGAYLLVRSGLLAGLRRRRVRSGSRPPLVVIGHVALATSGLAVWIAFASTGEGVLAWLAVGLIMAVAGLGMATLIGGLPDSESTAAAAARYARTRAAVPVIAVHGILAMVTIVVVILGAIAVS